jgi:hypothetical protein
LASCDAFETLHHYTEAKDYWNDMDYAILHSYALKALSGVLGASQAIAAHDYAGARMSLIKAYDAFDILSGLLVTDQIEVLTPCNRVLLRP